MSIRFNELDDNGKLKGAGVILDRWWRDLTNNSEGSSRNRRGDRARLRRCRSPSEVMFEPEFYNLIKRLGNYLPDDARERGWAYQKIATVAGLLSHIDTSDKRSMAATMASDKGGKPVITPLRFRRLLQCDRSDIYEHLIRVIVQLDKRANILDLAQSVYYWGDKVRIRWANDYFPKVTD